jgi:hypothetical protein
VTFQETFVLQGLRRRLPSSYYAYAPLTSTCVFASARPSTASACPFTLSSLPIYWSKIFLISRALFFGYLFWSLL